MRTRRRTFDRHVHRLRAESYLKDVNLNGRLPRQLGVVQNRDMPGAVVPGKIVPSDTGLCSPSAQPALVIALSDGHTPRAQDVVCGDGVEIEVGQRERKDEVLRREG
jgi:hypothetical protein